MNSADIFNGYMNNIRVEAKRQAEIDAIYEAERAKYRTPAPQPQSQVKIVTRTSNNNTLSRSDNDSLSKKIDKLERRIDKLYEIIGCKNDNSICAEDKLFVYAPKADIHAQQVISLSDEQFKILMKSIMTD